MRTNREKSNSYNLTKIALCIALLCVSSYIVIPVPFAATVFSLHSAVVCLIALIFPLKYALATIATYLLMGCIGLPVFAMGTAGVGKIAGPTGGYYFGFLLAVIGIGLLKGKKISFKRYLLVTIGMGLVPIHLCAVLFMCLHNGGQVWPAVLTISLPFLIPDILKCILASFLAVKLLKIPSINNIW